MILYRDLQDSDGNGRPYQFFTVGGPIETERTLIWWHWIGDWYGNWCSLNTASNFIRKWLLFGHGDWYGHGDGHGDGHSVNVPLVSIVYFISSLLVRYGQGLCRNVRVLLTWSPSWLAGILGLASGWLAQQSVSREPGSGIREKLHLPPRNTGPVKCTFLRVSIVYFISSLLVRYGPGLCRNVRVLLTWSPSWLAGILGLASGWLAQQPVSREPGSGIHENWFGCWQGLSE